MVEQTTNWESKLDELITPEIAEQYSFESQLAHFFSLRTKILKHLNSDLSEDDLFDLYDIET